MNRPAEHYLGDGVYVYVDMLRGMVVLTTNDGFSELERIYLDDSVIENFIEWLRRNERMPA